MKKIAVVGVGRLGLCLALNLERAGYEVTGVDVRSDYVDALHQKTLETNEPGLSEMLAESRNFVPTTYLKDALTCDDIFIVVATPSLPDGKYDHTYINDVARVLAQYGVQDKTKNLIINSTVFPGYCDELQSELKDLNYVISYNPEFIAQGSILNDQINPDMVLIGEGSTEAGDTVERIYTDLCDNKPRMCRMSTLSAEITKLSLNCFLTTKISFANMIGDICNKVGAEQEKVLDAIGSDSRIGNKYLKYGFGYGGPCFPRDNRALAAFAQENLIQANISYATDVQNNVHLQYQIEQKLQDTELPAVIVVDGVAYKKGTDILEESQQLRYALSLARSGFSVTVRDILAVIEQVKELHGDTFSYEVIEEEERVKIDA